MAITNILPADDSILDPSSVVTFDIDDTYTYIRIEVDTSDGVVYAYDSTLGGAQSGYTVSVSSSGGTDTFTITAESGWDKTPQVMYVTENETGTEAVATISWNLSGIHRYPQGDAPYDGQFSASFKVTEDDVGGAANVGWIDVVGPVGGVDGISVADLGGGKVRLTANATTNDPNAIHDNVANEISAITEKGAPVDDDLILIEDSEASYVKKKVKKINMGGARNPAKLNTDYSASLLYLFDGDRTNSAAVGTPADYDLGNATGDEVYTMGAVPQVKGMWTDNSVGCNSAAGTPHADVAAVGEVTVQLVFSPGRAQPESGGTDSNLVSMATDVAGPKTLWALSGLVRGSEVMVPAFEYIDSGSGAVSVSDNNYVIGDWVTHHIVGRRKDDGAGGYDVSLWVNGEKIAESLGELGAIAATANHNVRVFKYGANTGMCRGCIECLKVSNYALTDAEIDLEYIKAMGMPVENQ